ncbi:MAG: helix-hairpin-helix domain-containing protein [Marmoricola sp.]
MRRDGSETVTEAAQRRLELIARELADVGALEERSAPAWGEPEDADPGPSPHPPPHPPFHPAPAPPTLAGPAGRHLRRQPQSVPAGERAGGWLEDRLPLPLRGRVRLGSLELVVVALVAAVGLVFAAVSVLRADAGEITPTASAASGGSLLTPAAAGPRPAAGSTVGPAGAGTAAVPSGPASPSGLVVVDVAGRVRHPGVVRLPVGSRVVDALRRAGGARSRADLTSINLAAVLTDGQQILVGAPGRPPAAAGGTGTASAAGAGGPLLDLNAASQQDLEALPGVGPVTAQKILQWRTAHGAFSSLDELLEVDGIGPKTLADLAPHLTL